MHKHLFDKRLINMFIQTGPKSICYQLSPLGIELQKEIENAPILSCLKEKSSL